MKFAPIFAGIIKESDKELRIFSSSNAATKLGEVTAEVIETAERNGIKTVEELVKFAKEGVTGIFEGLDDATQNLINEAHDVAPQVFNEITRGRSIVTEGKEILRNFEKYSKEIIETKDISIQNPYLSSEKYTQQMSKESLAARMELKANPEVYRVGTRGRTLTNNPPGILDPKHNPTSWSKDNPLITMDYADKYGVYSNPKNWDFIETGKINNFKGVITRTAPPGEINLPTGELVITKGGGVEVTIEAGFIESISHNSL